MKTISRQFDTTHAIVLSANDFYVPYVSALLQSIIAHSSDRQYDIIVLTRDITKTNQDTLCQQVSHLDNVSVRFCDMTDIMLQYVGLHTPYQLTIETYYRLFAQDILEEYTKCLYMDCDMISLRDVSQLFDIDIDEYHLAACIDIGENIFYNSDRVAYQKKRIEKDVCLDSITKYFQAGLICFNLVKMRESFRVEDIMSIALSKDWYLADQDVLNHLMATKGSVYYLDTNWNFIARYSADDAKKYLSHEIYNGYLEAQSNPYVLHYAVYPKPWSLPTIDYAQHFWVYATQTPYYQELMNRLIHSIKKKDLRYSYPRLKKVAAFLFPLGSRRRKWLSRVLFGKQKDRDKTKI